MGGQLQGLFKGTRMAFYHINDTIGSKIVATGEVINSGLLEASIKLDKKRNLGNEKLKGYVTQRN